MQHRTNVRRSRGVERRFFHRISDAVIIGACVLLLSVMLAPLVSPAALLVTGFSYSSMTTRRPPPYRSLVNRHEPSPRGSNSPSGSFYIVLFSNDGEIEWEVFVDQSKASLDKGGSATLDAFLGLAPSNLVQVHPALLPKSSKAKGPSIRCISHRDSMASIDVGNVDSVDKVYRVLTRHMKVKGVSTKVCDCLKWKYRGNGYLEDGKVSLAIEAYGKALETGVTEQEGVILLARASAYMKRATAHKEQLKAIVSELIRMVPDASTLQTVYEEASHQPILATSIFRQILEKTATQKAHFRRTQYRHGLYQYALLKASQDSLRATELLPHYGIGYFRTGEILAELWKLKESMQYYERAMSLDPSLSTKVRSVIERLRRRDELLESARAYGWTDNALRLALDVSGG